VEELPREGVVVDKSPDRDPRAQPGGGLETTADLLSRLRDGDLSARDPLVSRYIPPLRRWAHGRLPGYARDLLDTDDLVQIALLRALDQIEGFEPRHGGAFLAYLKSIVQNQIKDEIRKVGRKPGREGMAEDLLDAGLSPLDGALARDVREKYEAALARLPAEQQEAVIMRIEMGCTYEEIAQAVGSPSPNAARMTISRALVRLSEFMDELRPAAPSR